MPNIRKLSQGRGDKALADATKQVQGTGSGVNRDPKQNFKVSHIKKKMESTRSVPLMFINNRPKSPKVKPFFLLTMIQNKLESVKKNICYHASP